MAVNVVRDWAQDFDHLDPAWVNDPFPLWDDLRATCPIATTRRYGGVYLPTRYADVRAIAYDPHHFSSRTIIVRETPLLKPFHAPPMTADEPRHRPARMVLLPGFTVAEAERHRDGTRRTARGLLGRIGEADRIDAARLYAHPLALSVMMRILGLPPGDEGLFEAWTRAVIITGITDPEVVARGADEMAAYFHRQILMRRRRPGDDAISRLLEARYRDVPVPIPQLVATLRLVMLAGIDTTASVIGAALWHLARHEGHRRALLAEPDLMPRAVEEFLRAYAPTTMAREVVRPTVLGGVRFERGRLVLLCFPAANRDPSVFANPEEIDFSRDTRKHLAFGIGIHRCIGMHAARMIIGVALAEWLAAFPAFALDAPSGVVWSPGTVRGPTRLPLVVAR